ncbi:uncharacterized protein CMU_005780 [Cryptosporidium muris RN66]|uniref:Uncharacterized protein n=1 Tax=Cryptosporidium muris (strain RN66) TaxID=441375 RepID=B6AHG0_CRYMR|nr:uncharacterized protein CMU_005780 [Cryptosporidium muris RN66]EEA07655.1 hypothetical protein CMU_005780 [Cryptosporidium muris RN66]|eukprot:XP_002142004.1 hypothetical protein [Cryptosporidium muris RN66]
MWVINSYSNEQKSEVMLNTSNCVNFIHLVYSHPKRNSLNFLNNKLCILYMKYFFLFKRLIYMRNRPYRHYDPPYSYYNNKLNRFYSKILKIENKIILIKGNREKKSCNYPIEDDITFISPRSLINRDKEEIKMIIGQTKNIISKYKATIMKLRHEFNDCYYCRRRDLRNCCNCLYMELRRDYIEFLIQELSLDLKEMENIKFGKSPKSKYRTLSCK